VDDISRVPRKTARPPVPADGEGLAGVRLRFLTAEPIARHEVREPVLASWMRSREFDVPADRIDLPYIGDQDLDTPLIRGADPVLRRLGEELDGQPISLILTDQSGVVMMQRTGDRDLHRHLEGVALAPGFSYGERFVGTNGIGTALQDGRPMHVFGHEHYAEHLEDLACAGVPIHHPISGRVVGAVDLTCWRRDAGGLLMALAKSTAEQVRQALLTQGDACELALFRAYLQTCRRTTGIVVAFNERVTMMNDRARRLLDPADQSALIGHATQVLNERGRASAVVALPTGSKVEMACRRVTGRGDTEIAGGVLSVQFVEADDGYADASPYQVPMFLPGAVGTAPLWLRCCHAVEAGYDNREWLMLSGEPGTGKHTVARAMHQRRNPTGRLHTVDAAEPPPRWREDLRRDLVEDPVDTLVVRHVDQMDAAGAGELAALLRAVRERPGPPRTWVVATLTDDSAIDHGLGELAACFARTVPVPPLRRHADDINELVPLFLERLRRGQGLSCSPAALHLLMRAPWPGNTAQLYQVLKEVTRRRRHAGTIRPADLPEAFRSAPRRSLNRLEAVERDAIVQGLEDADGDKGRAAQLLGMSRATIYRKISKYGIVSTAH
jgi:transcriptional regulator of acetoin/glycerol metabolism